MKTDQTTKASKRSSPVSAGRRRMIHAGLATGPVVMTVASKPVLGQTLACTVSTIGSHTVLTSHTTTTCVPATGMSPEWWKSHAATWPSPYCGVPVQGLSYQGVTTRDPTAYHCPTTGLGGRVFGSHAMIDVIDLTSGGRNLDTLGRYTVAALLNARSGRSPMLSETVVRNMWNDLIHRGYFEPTAGVRWGAPEIVAYIKTTIA
jgi:hypothetical protein